MSVASLSRSLARCARTPLLARSHALTGKVVLPRVIPALSLLRSTPSTAVRKFAVSAAECKFPGAPHATYTDTFEIVKDSRVIPVYRVMDESGSIVNKNFKPQLPDSTLLKMYKDMVTLNVMDQVFYDAQRQGRISFYMTSNGEEGATVASAAGLDASDVVYSQYREAGVFMWRGFTLAQFADQCFSNSHDLGKGRQMPVHYGTAALNIQTISSPLTTQLPHAAGAAYALKMANEKRIVIVYFGEGAASEGDFHAAMNFASTLSCPMIFFCRNNGYAISTPTHDQYHGDGIASRAVGYGMHYIRVDGNDVFAVQQATAEARSVALAKQVPVLIEAMSYRAGHHSTSDDSTRYRTVAEINQWQSDNNPITRLRMFMEKKNIWDAAKELELQQACRKEVLSQLTRAEIEKKPAAAELFTDVYDHPLPHLQRQQAELHAHLDKYHDKYDLSGFAPPKSA